MNIPIIFILLLIPASQSIQPRVSIPAQLPPGYYTASDKLFTLVFVNAKPDTAIVDFILFEKFPRELLTDTLIYNATGRQYKGRMAVLFEKGPDYYVKLETDSATFNNKKALRIKSDKGYYVKSIDEYKNIAVWNSYYRGYMKRSVNKVNSRKRFHQLEEQFHLDTSKKHSQFLVDFQKFKSAIEHNR